jgi:hypothetical protein
MECVALDVERAFDLQAGLGGRRGNQLDHGHAIDEGAPAPGLRDVAEQAMLDLIPLRGARRIMMDMEPEAGLVGEFCNSTFHSRTRVPFEPPPSAVIVSSRAFG